MAVAALLSIIRGGRHLVPQVSVGAAPSPGPQPRPGAGITRAAGLRRGGEQPGNFPRRFPSKLLCQALHALSPALFPVGLHSPMLEGPGCPGTGSDLWLTCSPLPWCGTPCAQPVWSLVPSPGVQEQVGGLGEWRNDAVEGNSCLPQQALVGGDRGGTQKLLLLTEALTTTAWAGVPTTRCSHTTVM